MSNEKAPFHSREKNNLWQPLGGLMIDISGWLVGPVIVTLIIGRWLDQKYHTEPWIMLGLLGLAFVVANIAILKRGLKALRAIQDQEKSLPLHERNDQS